MGKIRTLIMASTASERRMLHDFVGTWDDFEVVAVCASSRCGRDHLTNDVIHCFILDRALSESEANQPLVDLAHREKIRVMVVEPPKSAATPKVRPASSSEEVTSSLPPVPASPKREGLVAHAPVERPRARRTGDIEVVAVGSSTGGPDALAELITRIPEDFGATILIAQHMPRTFTPILARRLETRSRLVIREARDGEPLVPGHVLIAPGDFHLEVTEDHRTKLHQGPPENSCRPAVDVLFRSVAHHIGPRAVGVVLTGMGRDGLLGARLLEAEGAEIYVQDEATSVVWGMPGLISREGLADLTAPISDIAERLIRRCPNGAKTGPKPRAARSS